MKKEGSLIKKIAIIIAIGILLLIILISSIFSLFARHILREGVRNRIVQQVVVYMGAFADMDLEEDYSKKGTTRVYSGTVTFRKDRTKRDGVEKYSNNIKFKFKYKSSKKEYVEVYYEDELLYKAMVTKQRYYLTSGWYPKDAEINYELIERIVQ